MSKKSGKYNRFFPDFFVPLISSMTFPLGKT